MPRASCAEELAALHATIARLDAAAATPTPALDLLVARPRVGVGAILRCAAHPGRVLIGPRIGSHGAGRWALPGGHLEHGQSWAQCAAAEVEEECGVKTDVASWRLASATNDVMEEGLHYVTFYMEAEVSAEQAASVVNNEPHKCGGWEWRTWEEVAALPLFMPLRHFLTQCPGGVTSPATPQPCS